MFKDDRLVTIVVVPRERFSLTKLCLEKLYAVTSRPFSLVYVDGRDESPMRWNIAAYRRLLRDPNSHPYRAQQRLKLAPLSPNRRVLPSRARSDVARRVRLGSRPHLYPLVPGQLEKLDSEPRTKAMNCRERDAS